MNQRRLLHHPDRRTDTPKGVCLVRPDGVVSPMSAFCPDFVRNLSVRTPRHAQGRGLRKSNDLPAHTGPLSRCALPQVRQGEGVFTEDHHLIDLIRSALLPRNRWARRRIVERLARLLGMSRRRAERLSRNVP